MGPEPMPEPLWLWAQRDPPPLPAGNVGLRGVRSVPPPDWCSQWRLAARRSVFTGPRDIK